MFLIAPEIIRFRVPPVTDRAVPSVWASPRVEGKEAVRSPPDQSLIYSDCTGCEESCRRPHARASVVGRRLSSEPTLHYAGTALCSNRRLPNAGVDDAPTTPREGVRRRGAKVSYLVDPASSHMLVSKIKPCMCKYKLFCTVKLRMAH